MMMLLSDKLQTFINDFSNGEADDSCQDAFNRLVDYAEELETAYAKATVVNVNRPHDLGHIGAVDPLAPKFTPDDSI